MIVVDSCGWIEYFADTTLADTYEPLILNKPKLIVPSVCIFEVYKWVFREMGMLNAQVSGEAMKEGYVVPLSSTLSILAAQASIDFKLPLADAIVYATAQSCGAVVATHDKHFKGLEGVEFVKNGR